MMTEEERKVWVSQRDHAKRKHGFYYRDIQVLRSKILELEELRQKWESIFEEADRALAMEDRLHKVSAKKQEQTAELTTEQLMEVAAQLGIEI